MKLTKLAILGKWLLGIGIIWYLTTILDFREILATMTQADHRFLALGLLFILANRTIHSWQTKTAIAHHAVPLTLGKTFSVNLISQFYSLFLPGDLSGGAVKWYKLSQPSGKRAEVFAAIFFLRLINTTFIVLFGIIGIMIDSPSDSPLLFQASLFLLAGLAGVYLCLFTQPIAGWLESYVLRAPAWMPMFIWDRMRKVLTSITQYRDLTLIELTKILTVPIIAQLLTVLLMVSVAKALYLTIPTLAFLWIGCLVYIIQLIPATISGLGIREGALVFLLPYYGVAPASALSFSLLYFSYTIVLGILGGILEGWDVLGKKRTNKTSI